MVLVQLTAPAPQQDIGKSFMDRALVYKVSQVSHQKANTNDNNLGDGAYFFSSSSPPLLVDFFVDRLFIALVRFGSAKLATLAPNERP